MDDQQKIKEFATQFGHVMSFASTYSSGWVRPDMNNSNALYVHANKNIRNVDNDSTRTMHEIYSNSTTNLIHSTEMSRPAIYDISTSGMKTIVIRNDEKSITIDISNKTNNIMSNTRLNVKHVHGKVIGDNWFGGCSWSADEKYFCYMAQPINSKDKSSYFLDKEFLSSNYCNSNQKSGCNGDGGELTNPIDTSTAIHDKFEYVEDWGECYVGVSTLGLYVLNTETGEVHEVPTTQLDRDSGCKGQPQFVTLDTNGKTPNYSIVYTKWSSSPKRFGMIYCFQRPCKLYAVDITCFLRYKEIECSECPSSDILKENSIAMPDPVCLTEELYLSRTSRFYGFNGTSSSHGYGLVAFVGRKAHLSTHNGCFELYVCKVKSIDGGLEWSPPQNVIPLVEIPEVLEQSNELGFPGLFVTSLPARCFLPIPRETEEIGVTLYLSCLYGCREVIGSITLSANTSQCPHGKLQIIGGAVKNMILSDSGPAAYAHSVIEINPVLGTLLYSLSGCNCPPRLMLIHLNSFEQASKMQLDTDPGDFMNTYSVITTIYPLIKAHNSHLNGSATGVSNYKSIRNGLSRLQADIQKIQSKVYRMHHTIEVDEIREDGQTTKNTLELPFECIVLNPSPETLGSNCKKLPVVVVPHGGPHSAFISGFMAPYAYLCLTLPCCVILVNYTGSTGYGEASIRTLAGTCGDTDIRDVMSSTEYVLENHVIAAAGAPNGRIQLDRNRIGIVGGSHGGFLTGHAIGQYPDFFKAACMRNPVTNMASMTATTDIPDWCGVEANGVSGFDFQTYVPPNPKELQQMYEKSPIFHIKKVKTPTLICLGAKDRRVPYTQGLEFYHTLKSIYDNRDKIDSKGEDSFRSTASSALRLVIFPEDTHAIDHPASEAEHWIEITCWLYKHLCINGDEEAN